MTGAFAAQPMADRKANLPSIHTNIIESRNARVHHSTNIWPSRKMPTVKVILLTHYASACQVPVSFTAL
jgi:hypothetical protein